MTEEETAGVDSLSGKFWISLAIAVSLAAIILRYTSYNTHDNSWLLYASGEFLKGSKLYVNLAEVNPPLIIYIYSVPVALAELFSVQIRYIFYAYVIVLAAISSSFVYRLAADQAVLNRGFLLLLLAIALLVLPRENFGQREHFMVIFALPYVFLLIRRGFGLSCAPGLALFIGLYCVLGIGLKHYFILIPAVIELYLLLRTRKFKSIFRPETLALGTGLTTYVASIFLLTPEYITHIIPMALAVYSQGFAVPFSKVFFCIELIVLGLVTMVGALMLIEGKSLSSPVVVLFLAGLAGFIAYLVQAKGWNYQAYPALAFLFVTSGLLVAAWSRQNSWKITKAAAFTMAILTLLMLPILSLMDYRYKNSTIQPWHETFAQHQIVSSFYIMSSSLSPGFPLATISKLEWASRFPHLWLMPGIVRGAKRGKINPGSKLAETEKYQIDAMVEDLNKFRPQIVLVDARSKLTHFGGTSFDYIGYFSKDARFRKIWADYESIGSDKFGFRHYKLKNRFFSN